METILCSDIADKISEKQIEINDLIKINALSRELISPIADRLNKIDMDDENDRVLLSKLLNRLPKLAAILDITYRELESVNDGLEILTDLLMNKDN